MAASLFVNGKENILDGTVDLLTENLAAYLVDHGVDTPVPATDDTLADITGAFEETSPNLSSKTVTGGVFDCADAVFTGTTGNPCESFVIAQNSGVESTSELILFDDAASGLPVTLGGDITIQFDSGANKVFNWSG